MNNNNFNPNQPQDPNNTPNQYQPPQGQQPPQGYNPNVPPYQGQYPQYSNQFQPQPPKGDRLKIIKICAVGLLISLIFLACRWIFVISLFAFIAFSIVLTIDLSRYVKENNLAKTGIASGGKLTGCGTSFFLFLFLIIALAISSPDAEKSVPSETSSELNEVISTEIVSEIETDTTIVSSAEESSAVQSKAESSKVESKAESKTESKDKSESSSKSENSSKETESKIEVEKPKSNYILDFDSVQYGEYNIDGLEIPNGKIESVIRGGSDGNTLVVKVVFDDASSPTMKSYENVCDLIINHGFDKGSKIDYWAVNSDGVKVKAFILNSSYFNDIKDGTLPYNALHLFLQDEYPAY